MQWETCDARFDSYLRDESRRVGHFDAICFPADPDQLREALADCARDAVPVTVQGARTGIAGAAVPLGGRVISTERLTAFRLEGGLLTAQCGARLSDIRAAARAARLCFPPDPTEDSAAIGGAFACAASGPNCLRYGDVSRHVEGLSLLLADGRRWALRRGEYVFDRTGCPLPGGGRLELSAPLPPAGMPRWGFAPTEGLDLMDLFCGSQGTLAVISEFTLRLAPPPPPAWGLLFFFGEEDSALRFARRLAETRQEAVSVEFLDGTTLALISAARETSSQLAGLPAFPARQAAAVYTELCLTPGPGIQSALMDCLALFAGCGGRESDTWAASGEAELARLHLLRHAAAESVNLRLDRLRQSDPALTKLCAAYQTPLARMEEAAAAYRADLDAAGICGAVFGHASVGRLHVNLLPERAEQLPAAAALLDRWAGLVRDLGGQALAENGAGKNRLDLFRRWAPAGQLAAMAEIKVQLDPAGLLGPGTLPEFHTSNESGGTLL